MDWSASHSRPYQPESGSKVMNIQRSSNADDILRDYQVLQQRGTFTDINFVLRDGVVISAHSLIFAASSALVKEWMETTTIWPSNKFTIMLPDVPQKHMEAVISILYGVSVAVPSHLLDEINDLADMLGISVDLPFTVSNSTPGGEVIECQPNSENPESVMCCWHCSQSFGDFPALQNHILTCHDRVHLPGKRKIHRCNVCFKVLPSMWKLRQHYKSHRRPETTTAVIRLDGGDKGVSSTVLQTSAQQNANPPPASANAPPPPSMEKDHSRDDHSYEQRRVKKVAKLPDDRSDHQYSTRRLENLKRRSITPPPPKSAKSQPAKQAEVETVQPNVVHQITIRQAVPRDFEFVTVTEDNLNSSHNSPARAQNFVPLPELEAAKTSSAAQPKTLINLIEASNSDYFTSVMATRGKRRSKQKLSLNTQNPDQNSAAVAGAKDGETVLPKRASEKRRKVKANQTVQAMGHSYAAARPRRISGSSGKGPSTKEMFPCDQCEKTFPQPYRLNRHIQEVHVKEKRHKCTFCDKAFFKCTSRDRHQLIHTEHDLWKCHLCHKNLRDQSSLKYHLERQVCQKDS